MVEQFKYLPLVAWLGGLHKGIGHLGVDYVTNYKALKYFITIK